MTTPPKPTNAPPPPPNDCNPEQRQSASERPTSLMQVVKQKITNITVQPPNNTHAANQAATTGAAVAHEQGGGTDFSSFDQSAPVSSPYGMSYPVGTITGIRIRAHWLLPFVLIFSALVGAAKDGASGFGTFLLLYGPVLFGAVLLHELCHCWAAKRYGGTAEEVLLWPLGGLAFIGNLTSAEKDLKVAVAGPLSHLPQIFLFMTLTAIVNGGKVEAHQVPHLPSHGFWTYLFFESMMMHVLLFAFNLFLPCYPLDGGRVLADALLMRGMPAVTAAKVVVAISVPIALVLFISGILLFIDGNAHAVITIFVALWMAMQIRNLWRLISSEDVSQHPLFANAKEWEAPPPRQSTAGPDAVVAAV